MKRNKILTIISSILFAASLVFLSEYELNAFDKPWWVGVAEEPVQFCIAFILLLISILLFIKTINDERNGDK